MPSLSQGQPTAMRKQQHVPAFPPVEPLSEAVEKFVVEQNDLTETIMVLPCVVTVSAHAEIAIVYASVQNQNALSSQ